MSRNVESESPRGCLRPRMDEGENHRGRGQKGHVTTGRLH